jgi:hypothetical protein
MALVFAPFLWAGLDLAAARITSVPWDQLGYSQIDNALVNQLAPWTGVYGITFILVAVNALLAGTLLVDRGSKKIAGNQTARLAGRWAWAACGAVLLISGFAGVFVPPPKPDPTATAVLIQPNLDVGAGNNWQGPEWDRHIAEFTRLAGEQCKTYIAGIPQTGAPTGEIICPPYPTHPDLVVWPESPAPFIEDDPASSRPCGRSPSPRRRRSWSEASAWISREKRMPGATTTPRSSSTPAARWSAATTKSTSSLSANTFRSRTCSPSPTTHRPSLVVHARQRAQVFLLDTQNGGTPSLRRLHLL